MRINDPTVVAELMDLHSIYEKALIDNDVPVLDSLFWDSSHAIRYGVGENLHGTEQIRAFRKGRPAVNLARTVTRLDVMSLGESAGIINLEFARTIYGAERLGRQTQFWFRFDNGWKIVSAHVSLLPAPPSHPDAVAAAVGLKIDPANQPGVNADLSRLTAIAKFLMEFPLGQDVEAAPVFRP